MSVKMKLDETMSMDSAELEKQHMAPKTAQAMQPT